MKKSRLLGLLFFILLLLVAIPVTVFLVRQPQKLGKEAIAGETSNIIVKDDGNTISTYSPWVMHEPGWDRYVMFFNSMNNVDGDGTYKDRIYQIENFGDGINNWGPSYSVLFPDVDPRPGESGLIADPAVVRTDVWHMYYTGTDGDGTDFSVMTNNIFHATSPDKMTWTKQGMITGLPVGVIGQYGVGEPSVIYEDGIYRLFYFFSSGLGIAETRVAESSDGYNFTDKGKVVTWTVPNPLQPDVRKEGTEYVLTYTDLTTAIYQSRSSNPYSFPVGVKLLDKQDWFSEYLITPNYLPNEGKLYFAGQTAKDFVGQDTQIGVRYPIFIPTPTSTPTLTPTPSTIILRKRLPSWQFVERITVGCGFSKTVSWKAHRVRLKMISGGGNDCQISYVCLGSTGAEWIDEPARWLGYPQNCDFRCGQTRETAYFIKPDGSLRQVTQENISLGCNDGEKATVDIYRLAP